MELIYFGDDDDEIYFYPVLWEYMNGLLLQHYDTCYFLFKGNNDCRIEKHHQIISILIIKKSLVCIHNTILYMHYFRYYIVPLH